jgi:hypothetical protein
MNRPRVVDTVGSQLHWAKSRLNKIPLHEVLFKPKLIEFVKQCNVNEETRFTCSTYPYPFSGSDNHKSVNEIT